MRSKILKLEHTALQAQMESALHSRGVEPESVTDVTVALIETSLRGVDSHGINLFPHYFNVVNSGRINVCPNLKMLRRSAGAGVLDADHGFGHRAGHFAIDEAIEMAKETGVGAVAVRNSSHFGAAAYYGLLAARRGYIGLVFTNADALVNAYGSALPFFGTNPICLTAPMEGEDPFCLDMATSQVSWNKILNYRRTGEAIPPTWALDKQGLPTESADEACSLSPAGLYKGFGLGMIVEILCGLLSGGPVARDLIAMYERLPEKRYISQFYIVLNIESFVPGFVFRQRLTDMARKIRSLPALDKANPPQIPGDPEKRTMKFRLEYGIPVDSEKFDEFLKVSPDFSKALLS